MRKELEQIERIEAYILGDLSTEERNAFESELKYDESLHKNYLLQLQIMDGIERAELVQIANASYHHWKFLRALKITSFFAAGTGIAVTSFFLFASSPTTSNTEIIIKDKTEKTTASEQKTKYTAASEQTNEKVPETRPVSAVRGMEINLPVATGEITNSIRHENIAPENREIKKTNPAYNFSILTEKNLAVHVFEINNHRDTTLFLPDGTGIRITENSFKTGHVSSRNNRKDLIKIEFIEATSMADMVKGGLFTISENHTALETSGIYYLRVTSNGKEIEQLKPLSIAWINSPALPSMNLYAGSTTDTGDSLPGKMTWISPRHLKSPEYAVMMDFDKRPVNEGKNSFWIHLLNKIRKKKNAAEKNVATEQTLQNEAQLNYTYQDSVIVTGFASVNQGWTGMNRIFEGENFLPFNAAVKIHDDENFSSVSVAVVFRNHRVFIPALRNKAEQNFIFTDQNGKSYRFPVNEEAVIIVYGIKNGKTYFGYEEIKTAGNIELKLDPEQKNPVEISHIIDALFK